MAVFGKECCCLLFWLWQSAVAFLSPFAATAASGGGDVSDKANIYFSYITDVTGPLLSIGAQPVVDLALEQINNSSDILPNYILNYTTIRDSKCSVVGGLDAFNQDFINKSETNYTYLTLFGCGCSTATIPVAQISHYWNIPHIAFAAAADALNDKKRFRSFFRTVPQYEFLPRALLEVTKQFKWSKMSVITQNENLFETITKSFTELAAQQGSLSLDTSFEISSRAEPLNPDFINNILTSGTNVTFINTYQNFAIGILCNAFHEGLLAPRHIWITHSWYTDNWWTSTSVNESCTDKHMEKVLNRSLAISPRGFFPLENETIVTESGLTSRQYKDMYNSQLNDSKYENLTHLEAAGMAFDAVWAIALGLNNTLDNKTNDSECIGLPGERVELKEFNYTNEQMGCVLQKGFELVNFTGITGNISLANRSRVDNNRLVLHQYRVVDDEGPKRIVVANFDIDSEITRFNFASNESASTLWPVLNRVHHNHPALQIIYSILATGALALVAACLALNIFLMKKDDFKIVSPALNFLVIVGAALLYISVYLYVFTADGVLAQTLICNFRQWMSSVGYMICFAVFLAKTWRGYYLFNNPNPKIKHDNDWVLLVIVAVVVTVDLFIMFIGTVAPTSRLNATLVDDIQHPHIFIAEGRAIKNVVYTCISFGTVIWLAISYAYKGFLQLVAMFMAFHIRKANLKSLSDSKEIAVIIYINSITLALLAVVEFALNTYHDVYAALFGLGLMVGTTIFLSLVFIPKIFTLCKARMFQDTADTKEEDKMRPIEDKLPETSTALELQ